MNMFNTTYIYTYTVKGTTHLEQKHRPSAIVPLVNTKTHLYPAFSGLCACGLEHSRHDALIEHALRCPCQPHMVICVLLERRASYLQITVLLLFDWLRSAWRQTVGKHITCQAARRCLLRPESMFTPNTLLTELNVISHSSLKTYNVNTNKL